MKKIFVVAALITSSQLHAQEPAHEPQDTTTLNEVTVSANKYPTRTYRTGKVIILINRTELEKAGGKDLAQVLNEQGGIYLNGANSNPGKDKSVFVRGGRVEHTLITIDGVPVYDASGIGSNFDIRQIPIDQVERVEVLKGSQSTLYGSDAIAGVIHIITRKGSAKPLSVNAMLSGGSYHTIRSQAAVSGKYKKTDYHIGHTFFDTKGISEAAVPANANDVYDRDGYRQNAFHANLGFQFRSNWRLLPTLRFSTIAGDLDQEAFVDEKDFSYEAKNFQAGIRNEFTFGKSRLNLSYNFNKIDRNYIDDSIKSRNGFLAYSKYQYASKEHFAEAIYVYPFHKINFTAGADYRQAGTDQSSFSEWGPGKPLSSDSGQHQVGVFSAAQYQHKSFSLETGARFNQHSAYGGNFAFNINPSLLVQQQWKVFANLSSGYKVPGLYQLYAPDYGNQDLSPEEALNTEAGLQYFTKDEKASIRAVYFRRQVKDVIVFNFNPANNLFHYFNQDEQKDRGWELDAKWKPNTKLDLKVFYAFVDGEITTKKSGKDTTYFNLYRRPKSRLNVNVGSQLTKKLYASLQTQVVGKAIDLRFDPITFAASDVKLDSYVLLNFYTEYSFPKNKLKLFADIRNLTDVKYTEVFGYNTPGLNAYGGLRFNF